MERNLRFYESATEKKFFFFKKKEIVYTGKACSDPGVNLVRNVNSQLGKNRFPFCIIMDFRKQISFTGIRSILNCKCWRSNEQYTKLKQ